MGDRGAVIRAFELSRARCLVAGRSAWVAKKNAGPGKAGPTCEGGFCKSLFGLAGLESPEELAGIGGIGIDGRCDRVGRRRACRASHDHEGHFVVFH